MSKWQELFKKHPRVAWHKKGTKCSALTSSRGSVKMYYHKDPEVRKTAQERAACKVVAHWKFKALKKSYAKDGDYCWTHLIHFGLYGDMLEEGATTRWLKKHPEVNNEEDVSSDTSGSNSRV